MPSSQSLRMPGFPIVSACLRRANGQANSLRFDPWDTQPRRIGELRAKIAKSISIPENMGFCNVAAARGKPHVRLRAQSRQLRGNASRLEPSLLDAYAAIPSVR
ncbi:MAG: hypothetical protein ABIL01_06685 [Pseudomonadota bacterium]